MASTSWGVRALRHGQARTVALSRVLARLFLTLRRSWLVDVVVFGGAPGGNATNVQRVRGSNARRAVRAYGSAGWTALGLTLVSEIVDSTTHDTLHEFVHNHITQSLKAYIPAGNTVRTNTARPRRRVPPATDPRAGRRPAPRPTATPGRDPARLGPRGARARGCQPRDLDRGARKPQRAQEHRRRPLHRTRM
jgi:hypothetical protein